MACPGKDHPIQEKAKHVAMVIVVQPICETDTPWNDEPEDCSGSGPPFCSIPAGRALSHISYLELALFEGTLTRHLSCRSRQILLSLHLEDSR